MGMQVISGEMYFDIIAIWYKNATWKLDDYNIC